MINITTVGTKEAMHPQHMVRKFKTNAL